MPLARALAMISSLVIAASLCVCNQLSASGRLAATATPPGPLIGTLPLHDPGGSLATDIRCVRLPHVVLISRRVRAAHGPLRILNGLFGQGDEKFGGGSRIAHRQAAQ